MKHYEFRNRVKIMFSIGWSIKEIAEHKSVSIEEIEQIVHKDMENLYYETKSSRILGSKTETYFTEEELLNPPEYTYESLSPEEKKIYDEPRNNQ